MATTHDDAIHHLGRTYADTALLTLFSGTSPAAAGTSAQTAVANLEDYDNCVLQADLNGATGGTLDVYVQTSFDLGVTWRDVAHFTQLTAGGGAHSYLCSLAREATNPTAPIAVNSANGTPALAAATVVPGALGGQLRVVFVAGVSTSAGAAQLIQAFLSTN